MKKRLGTLAVAVLLAGCGSEPTDAAPKKTWDFGGHDMPTNAPEPPPSADVADDVTEVEEAAAPVGTFEGDVLHLELPEQARAILTPESKLTLDVLTALAPQYEARDGQIYLDRMPEADYLCANTFGSSDEVAARFTLSEGKTWESRIVIDPSINNPLDPVDGVGCAWYPVGDPHAWDLLLNFYADPEDPDPCSAAQYQGISCVRWGGDLVVYALNSHPYRGDNMDIAHLIDADDQAMNTWLHSIPQP